MKFRSIIYRTMTGVSTKKRVRRQDWDAGVYIDIDQWTFNRIEDGVQKVVLNLDLRYNDLIAEDWEIYTPSHEEFIAVLKDYSPEKRPSQDLAEAIKWAIGRLEKMEGTE